MRFIFLLAALLSTDVIASTGLDQLNRFHSDVASLQGEFIQVLRDDKGNKVQESKGTVWIKKPGLFRWEYTDPYPQIIVGDGRRIWIYDPELEQVTVKKESNAIGKAPALVLSGKQPLNKNFVVTEIQRSDGYDWVSLVPKKEDSDFSEISVAFKKDTLAILELKDKLGQKTSIHFIGLKVNSDIDKNRFKFRMPANTDIIGDE
ncbi:MAG TPA: outer membrane lipoprotein chaperone LolA [Gammaproteobacteria bacterium]|nr:outer membrane lipoprotein chaperone LolA [Gammaproteobacteria bacterium]